MSPKPLQLREIRIEASRLAPCLSGIPFRWTAHHVREIFTALLPRGYQHDGSSVIQITCGPRGAEPQYHRVLGSSEYYVEEFNFTAYEQSSPADKEECLLRVLVDALCDIADRLGLSKDVVCTTAAAVRTCGFRLSLPQPNLKKRVPGTSMYLEVVRCLFREEGESWTLRLATRTGQIIREFAINERPDFLDRRDMYRKARIDSHEYVLINRLGKTCFRLDMTKLGLFCTGGAPCQDV